VRGARAGRYLGRTNIEDRSGNPLANVEVRSIASGKTLAAHLETDGRDRFQTEIFQTAIPRSEASKPNYIGSSLHMKVSRLDSRPVLCDAASSAVRCWMVKVA